MTEQSNSCCGVPHVDTLPFGTTGLLRWSSNEVTRAVVLGDTGYRCYAGDDIKVCYVDNLNEWEVCWTDLSEFTPDA